MGAVGFFNSNRLAGASQRHKHMQLLPLDILLQLRGADTTYATVLDELVLPRLERGTFKSFPGSLSSPSLRLVASLSADCQPS